MEKIFIAEATQGVSNLDLPQHASDMHESVFEIHPGYLNRANQAALMSKFNKA